MITGFQLIYFRKTKVYNWCLKAGHQDSTSNTDFQNFIGSPQ